MSKINYAIISAAGIGSRLGKNMPKTLVNITETKKIIDYQIEFVGDIKNIRLVVGYQHEKVVEYIKEKDYDVEIIHNPGFRNNTTCYSMHLATEDLDEPYVALDGDLLINKNEFNNFVKAFNDEPLIGITPSKTEDGVYVNLNENNEILSFQRNPKTSHEWANIACFCEPIVINKNGRWVYSHFEPFLPLKSFTIENCYEVDTPQDLELAIKNLDKI